MPLDDVLRHTAEQCGVQQEFWDIFGRPHRTTPATNQAILTAIGFDCSNEATLEASISARAASRWRDPLPPALVVLDKEPIRIPLRSLPDARELNLELFEESGRKSNLRVGLQDVPISAEAQINGMRYVERTIPLSEILTNPLPLGYHELRAWDSKCKLIVAPECAVVPKNRSAGLGITLWGLRSERNWGVGDFRDLRQLVDWAYVELHAAFVALNPLHAIQNRRPYNCSPYLPNSTFYRNFIYIDVESVPGYSKVSQECRGLVPPELLDELRSTETVEYERVSALKLEVLARVYEAEPPSQACKEWIEQEGDLLHIFCIYSALDEHLHASNPDLWIWPDWPEEFRDPYSPAVQQFAREKADRIRFHGWLQWLIDQQISEVQRHAKEIGMSIGLYHDLALATDRCGSDLWAHRPYYVAGCRVGSPPDDFSPTGQDWSFPPPNTEKHRQDGYGLYIESIRKSLRHGGALRIDHVMRLFRLYWIPENHDAMQGAYVRDRAKDLVRILALESVRNDAIVIGEDLGTVEPEVREALAKAGILSYRLLYFERKDGGFKLPWEYPEQALAASTTHDLPTITGFWHGADIEARQKAGKVDDAGYQSQWADRVREKQRLLDALFAAGLMPESYERDSSKVPELTAELHFGIVGFLANTSAALWLINQEDLTKEPNQQNLPGTTAEYPNWSRKMRWTIEELRTLPAARDCAAMARHWVERSNRA